MKPDTAPITLHWPRKVNQIPKEVFVREDLFKQEIERIFHGPEWHPVAHTSEIPKAGDFKTAIVARVPFARALRQA